MKFQLPKRVVLFGTESTGKTSLAHTLAAYFEEPWSAEFVRDFWDLHNGKIGPEDLDAIARGQMANEDRAADHAGRVVFCDTDLLTCTLWNDLLFPGACPAWVRAEAEERARWASLYLLCDTDVPFEPDPQRCFPDMIDRTRARGIWREALLKRRLPVVEIVGDWEFRATLGVSAVETLLEEGRAT
ncbi:MAG TPA: AAA family ATPase [Opitutaceae bacterium]|nr:AAA family ATPase [Opitutaceae bacterium]